LVGGTFVRGGKERKEDWVLPEEGEKSDPPSANVKRYYAALRFFPESKKGVGGGPTFRKRGKSSRWLGEMVSIGL